MIEPRRDWGKGVMVLCTHFVRPARYGQSSRTFRRQTAFVGRALCYVPSRHSLSSRQDSPTQRAPSSMLASEGFDELTLFRSYEAKSDPSQEDELALGIPDKYALRLSRAPAVRTLYPLAFRMLHSSVRTCPSSSTKRTVSEPQGVARTASKDKSSPTGGSAHGR